MSTPRHWLYAAVFVTAAFFSILLLMHALWIPLKAELAQWLIEKSWQSSLQGTAAREPWPWADTRAVGVLSVPQLDIRQVILEGNSGRNLAFGPVIPAGMTRNDDWVISGHRDTHFQFLARLKEGDLVGITTSRSTRWFEVRAMEVIDSRQEELIIEPGLTRLSLVTCYPFDSPGRGGALRYVVTALPVDAGLSPHPLSSG